MAIDTNDYDLFSMKNKKASNEDYVVRLSMQERPGDGLELVCVFDGISTASGGESAQICRLSVFEAFSALFRETLPLLLDRAASDGEAEQSESDEEFNKSVEALLVDLIRFVNQRLTSYGREHRISVGSTVSIALVVGGFLYAANVGDSPIYLFQPNEEDLMFLDDEGRYLLRKPYEHQANGSALTYWLGDPIEDYGIVHTDSYPLRTDNVLLLGSDGALTLLGEEEYISLVEDTVRSGRSMKELCQALQKRIKTSECSIDNASVFAMRIGMY